MAESGLSEYHQQKKILATDAQANDYFSEVMAMSGANVIIGSNKKDTTGVAYIYNKNQYGHNNWGEVIKLTATDKTQGQFFADSVDIEQQLAVVGAKGDNERGDNAGAAYVFYQQQGTWVQIAKLIGDDTVSGDRFGNSISISGDTIAVGAFNHNSNDLQNSGAVYLFGRNQGGADQWGQITQLSDPLGSSKDHFGVALALDGNTLTIGAANKNAVSAGNVIYPLNYQPQARFTFTKLDEGFCGEDAGAAFVFSRQPNDPNQWQQVAQFTANNAECSDHFGSQLAISGATIAVGVPTKDIFDRLGAGSVFIYTRDHGGDNRWGESAVLEASDGRFGDHFGSAVDIHGDLIAVGAKSDDNGGFSSGSAYLFKRNAEQQWLESKHLFASDAESQDRFGTSIAVNEQAVIIGASFEASSGLFSGAAYIFHDGSPALPAASYAFASGLLSINAVDIPGLGLYKALLTQATDGSFVFTVDQLTPTNTANTAIANYFTISQILHLPSLNVQFEDATINNYNVDLRLLDLNEPYRFELHRVR